MPQIREFDTGALALRPTEIGVDAQAAAARRIGAFSNQEAAALQALGRDTEGLGSMVERGMDQVGRNIGSGIVSAGDAAVKYEDHREISQGSAAWAAKNAEWINTWNDRVKNADPNDPTVAAKFRDDLEQQLEDFKGNFHTDAAQQWAESHIEAFRNHMFEKTSADMSTLAGDAAKVNARQTVNSLSNAVRGDPSSLDYALKTLDSSVAGVVGSSPNLTGAASASVRMQITEAGKEAIVKSAAVGYIERTGQVPGWASDPKYSKYINGAELKQFEKAAQIQNRTVALQQKQAELFARQQETQAAHVASTKNFADNVTYDPVTNRAVIDPKFFQGALDIAKKYPNAPDAATIARTNLDWGEAQQRERREVVNDDPSTRLSLLGAVNDPTKPTTEVDVRRAEVEGKLSPQTGNQLVQLVRAIQERPEGQSLKDGRATFFRQYARVIDPGYTQDRPTALGSQRLYEAEMTAREQEADLRAKGLNPALVYDPRSEYFFGRPENIAKYHVSMQDANKYQTQIDTPKPLPPAGEREKDKTYSTPRGPMRWTGTGWVAP